jgi:glyoxylase-like metal-dependent hydrolase (beta-lactamase superfamily II)
MDSPPLRAIDVRHLGHERLICCFLLGDVLIDCGPASSAPALIDALAERPPRALALTHIHLDHAGAAGTLVERWPALEVWVHERGAPHLVDPSRLLASAERLYGDQMQTLWGETRPVPEANLRVLRGGERRDGLEVAYTPGHASHHVCYWDPAGATAFVGDVAGVRAAPSGYVLAPTPPPDIDVELWLESIERVRAWGPRRLAITHFGLFEDAGAQLDAIALALERSARLARDLTPERFAEEIGREIDADADARGAPAYALGAPLEQCYAGLERYWSKRGGRS